MQICFGLFFLFSPQVKWKSLHLAEEICRNQPLWTSLMGLTLPYLYTVKMQTRFIRFRIYYMDASLLWTKVGSNHQGLQQHVHGKVGENGVSQEE